MNKCYIQKIMEASTPQDTSRMIGESAAEISNKMISAVSPFVSLDVPLIIASIGTLKSILLSQFPEAAASAVELEKVLTANMESIMVAMPKK